MKVMVTTVAINVQNFSQVVTINKSKPNVLQARCPSCQATNSIRAMKGKSITFHGLAHPKLTWGSADLAFDH